MINEDAYWEAAEERIRRDLADCSTADYHSLSDDAVRNLAGVAARAARQAMRVYLAGLYEMQHKK